MLLQCISVSICTNAWHKVTHQEPGWCAAVSKVSAPSPNLVDLAVVSERPFPPLGSHASDSPQNLSAPPSAGDKEPPHVLLSLSGPLTLFSRWLQHLFPSMSLNSGQRCQTSGPGHCFVIFSFSDPNLCSESVAFNPDLLFKDGNWALGSFDKQLWKHVL